MKKYILIFILLTANCSFAQTPSELRNYFQQAATEFNVPTPVLEALAYIETHWQPIPNIPGRSPMGLRNDSRFNYNLDSAAELIGKPVKTLDDSAYENIRGAAAFLSHLRGELNADSAVVTDSLVTWWPVIADYSGIPQPDIAMEFAYHTLEYVASGVDTNGVLVPPQYVDLSIFPDSIKATGFRQLADSLMPPVWVGSPNYSSRNDAPIAFVIIHDTEEQFDYAHSLFEQPSDQASAHYLVRSQDGYVEQFVHRADRAWAVVCWNAITLNIEHEGFVADTSFYTEAEYESSARLTASMCEEYAVPEDSLHIFGHDAWSYPWFNLIPFPLYEQYTNYSGYTYSDCNTHTDPGHNWKWHHYFDLVHQYDTTRASVTGSTPTEGDTGSVDYSPITVNFSKPMDPTSTDSSFSISPAVPGTIAFNATYTQLYFQPKTYLSSHTPYTVTISSSAKSTNLRPIISSYTFQFTTGIIDTSTMHLIRVSPDDGGSSAAKSYVEFVLSKPIQLNSISSQISFVDSTGKVMPFSIFMSTVTPDGLTLIALHSTYNLKPGMKYTVSLASGLEDYYGIKTTEAISTTFICDTNELSRGSIIDGFESSSNNWLQPEASNGTVGIDSSATNFNTVYFAYDGSQSGRLNYSFNSTGGVCAVENYQGYDISGSTSFGMWVFGDNSGNELDYVFSSSSGGPEKIVPVDTINWFGYKFVGMWRSGTDAATSLFKGFAITHLKSAILDSSTIYVDDIQINGKVTDVDSESSGLPKSFSLFQNYPNPFNPATSIRYQLPKSCHVALKIYDALGREVELLVNRDQGAGTYSVSFNANKLPSGLYFYRLDAGSFTAIRKMMLVK